MTNGMPDHRFLTFYGSIRPPATNSLRVALCTLVNEGAKKITVLFASNGGSTEDGMALYTYLKALPVELEMHATGFVSSMGLPVFLAASERKASANARFFFHEFSWTYAQPTEITQTSMRDHSIQLEAAREWALEITKSNLKVSGKEFESLNLYNEPVIISPKRAVEVGLVSKVAEPAITANSQPRVVK